MGQLWLAEGLFPYLGCHGLHPWRDKGHSGLCLCLHHSLGRPLCLRALAVLLLVAVVGLDVAKIKVWL